MTTANHIRALMNRLARLDAAETWGDDLNPAQISALEYLSCANRFSRAPSQVAEYLGTTRGTMSQTLKALMRKGYVTETRSDADKRSIRYDLTERGVAVTTRPAALAEAIDALPGDCQKNLADTLSTLVKSRLTARGGRAFGLCCGCAHHCTTADGAFCALLSLPLAPEEGDQICHEQVAA
ncbi:MarR family transcriptional regulator [Hoeflea sp. CAU 1731]